MNDATAMEAIIRGAVTSVQYRNALLASAEWDVKRVNSHITGIGGLNVKFDNGLWVVDFESVFLQYKRRDASKIKEHNRERILDAMSDLTGHYASQSIIHWQRKGFDHHFFLDAGVLKQADVGGDETTTT